MFLCRCAQAYTYGFTAATIIGCVVAGALHYAVDTGINVAIGICLGVGLFAISVVVAFVVRTDKDHGFMEWFKIVVWAGSRNLRNTFKHNPSKVEVILHICTFDFMIKYICPPALLGALLCYLVCGASCALKAAVVLWTLVLHVLLRCATLYHLRVMPAAALTHVSSATAYRVATLAGLFINQAVNDKINFESGYGCASSCVLLQVCVTSCREVWLCRSSSQAATHVPGYYCALKRIVIVSPAGTTPSGCTW